MQWYGKQRVGRGLKLKRWWYNLEIKEIIYAVCVIVSFIINLIISISTSKHTSSKAQKREFLLSLLREAMRKAIEEVETYQGLNGEQKKEYVKSMIINFCNNVNLDYDSALIDREIDREVELSKNVNKG